MYKFACLPGDPGQPEVPAAGRHIRHRQQDCGGHVAGTGRQPEGEVQVSTSPFLLACIFDRPGVAGAVLQSPL